VGPAFPPVLRRERNDGALSFGTGIADGSPGFFYGVMNDEISGKVLTILCCALYLIIVII
jgi:hypothetical protein